MSARPRVDDPVCAAPIRAGLEFERGGGRTFLARQCVPYPFHITKPHYLDRNLPELATLCLQSASGGLYRGDRLRFDVTAGSRVAAHITSQAATIVHTAYRSISLQTRLSLKADSFLALTTDPYVLFPGTSLTVSTDIVAEADTGAIVSEGFDWHDPGAAARPFGTLHNRTRLYRPDGLLLVDDETCLTGTDVCGAASPLGPYKALGSVMILGREPPEIVPMQAELDALGVFAGASALPNEAGFQVRLLAADGGHLARGLRCVYVHAFQHRFGFAPASPRR